MDYFEKVQPPLTPLSAPLPMQSYPNNIITGSLPSTLQNPTHPNPTQPPLDPKIVLSATLHPTSPHLTLPYPTHPVPTPTPRPCILPRQTLYNPACTCTHPLATQL